MLCLFGSYALRGWLTCLSRPVLQSIWLPPGGQKHSKYAGHQLPRTQVRFNDNNSLLKIHALSSSQKKMMCHLQRKMSVKKHGLCTPVPWYRNVIESSEFQPLFHTTHSAFFPWHTSSLFMSYPSYLEFPKAWVFSPDMHAYGREILQLLKFL